MRGVFRHMWMTLTASERKRFTTGVSIDIVISLLDIGFLATLIWIVQWYLQPQAGHTLSRVFGTGSLQPIGFFFVAFAVKNGAGFLQAQSQFRFSGRVAVRLSEQNLGAFQEAAYTEFVQGDMAQQIRQINHQPFDFCTYILSGMQQLFTQAILVGVAISAILLYNAALFLFLLLVLLPPVIAVFLFMKRTQHVAKTAIRSTNERSLQALIDALKGYVEANMFGSRQFFRDRYIQARAQFSHVYFRTIAVQAMPGRMIESFAVLGLLLLLALS
ncbi:MAG: transporter ATP-binding protein, partial [Flaviaesturariibacter sp.]|nr:transporter ATP-binding protein [Flaviaesturariibacter sp.]